MLLQRLDPTSLSAHGKHQVSRDTLVIQSWASQDADANLAIFNESQAHGVLVAAQKALGAVNGIQSPKASIGSTSSSSTSSSVRFVVTSMLNPIQHHRVGNVVIVVVGFVHCVAHMSRDLGQHGRVVA